MSPIPPTATKVLLTGFGPFHHYGENPSWLAVSKLHNTIISHSDLPGGQTPVHVTSAEVPVEYDAVLKHVPKIHARQPEVDLPTPLGTPPPTPTSQYDVVIHVGVANRPNISIESLAHKDGYVKPDVKGQQPESHGFAEGYEPFGAELVCDWDVDQLVSYLKAKGVIAVRSDNAGRYLCDFIYYCSLAESLKNQDQNSTRRTKVLFVHCPPLNEPLSSEQVAEALRLIVGWCSANINRKSQSNQRPIHGGI